MKSWRDRMAPAIAEVIRKHKGEPENVIRKALRDLWDGSGMGERAYHPYKVFLAEIRRQLGKKSAKKPLAFPTGGQSSIFEDSE